MAVVVVEDVAEDVAETGITVPPVERPQAAEASVEEVMEALEVLPMEVEDVVGMEEALRTAEVEEVEAGGKRPAPYRCL